MHVLRPPTCMADLARGVGGHGANHRRASCRQMPLERSCDRLAVMKRTVSECRETTPGRERGRTRRRSQPARFPLCGLEGHLPGGREGQKKEGAGRPRQRARVQTAPRFGLLPGSDYSRVRTAPGFGLLPGSGSDCSRVRTAPRFGLLPPGSGFGLLHRVILGPMEHPEPA